MARFNDESQNDNHNEYLAARLRKLTAEAEIKEQQQVIEKLKKEKLQSSLVSLSDVTETMISIGSRTKSQLLRMVGELPPRIEGLPAVQIENILREVVDNILLELNKDFTSNIDIDSEEFKLLEIKDEKEEPETPIKKTRKTKKKV